MPQRMGRLQQEGEAYANYLIGHYHDPICASKIENWRNRLTNRHDVDKFQTLAPNYNFRQAKQVVEYAKRSILPMINNFYANN